MFREKFQLITAVLRPYREWWASEVIAQYPENFALYPQEWIDDLERLQPDELAAVEREEDFSLLQNAELRAYWELMHSVSALPTASFDALPLSAKATRKVKAKKRHEIEVLSGVISELFARGNLTGLIDVGGGVGYLAQHLALSQGIRVLSIDCDAKLHDTGKQRLDSFAGGNSLQYLQQDCLSAQVLQKCLRESGISAPLLFGLHTCGALANVQLQAGALEQVPMMLNFSCCYYKMSEEDYYLSSAAQEEGLRLGNVARTLATRAPKPTPQAYSTSKRVKQYRYLIHLFLYHQLGVKEFIPLGSSAPEIYRKPFAEYATEQLARNNLGANTTKQQLSEFFADPANQRQARRMALCNVIRCAAARPLELLLLLDRAMFLESQGYRVTLAEYFDVLVSPRNIGILARRI